MLNVKNYTISSSYLHHRLLSNECGKSSQPSRWIDICCCGAHDIYIQASSTLDDSNNFVVSLNLFPLKSKDNLIERYLFAEKTEYSNVSFVICAEG